MNRNVVTIRETWLLVDIGDHEVVPPNYVVIRKERHSSASAVVIVLIQNISFRA